MTTKPVKLQTVSQRSQENSQTLSEFKTTLGELFKTTNGEPFPFTSSQVNILNHILNPDIKWLWISAPTRFGKSDVLAMGCLLLAAVHKLKVAIVGGSMEKANKIMEYVLSHISDCEFFSVGLLDVENIRDADKLKVMRSKQKLRWSHGGWIYITSIDSRQKSKEGTGVVGEGADVVILEEAGLITDEAQVSKVIRMPESKSGWGKLIMSGNMIEGSIFQRAYSDDLYIKVVVTLQQAMKERGWTQRELDEKKSQMTAKDWKRYYMMQFPEIGEFAYFKPMKYEFLPPDVSRYYGAVDLSLGEAAKGSLLAIVVLGISPSGVVYEVHSDVKRMSPDEALNEIINLPYEFRRFGIESVYFQKYFYNLIKKKSQELGKHIPFVELTQNTKKQERIESLEPVINTGQILFKGNNELYSEMQSYPEAEYLDGLDALEMCWRLVSNRISDSIEASAGGGTLSGQNVQKFDPLRQRKQYFEQKRQEIAKKLSGF